ncbi:MAG: FtsX-like permease family protein [Roseivirga sp.]|nr:FtsX-like permease family protein [Roseivirga sp.]
MNKLNLKTAIRNLRKKRLFAFVNIGGLTFGMLCALFIGTYVMHELSYDKFYPDYERIYRVNVNRNKGGLTEKGVIGPTGLKPYFDENIGQIEVAVRLQRSASAIFEKEQEFFKETGGFFADVEFFNLFGIKLLEGDAANALTRPEAIVISESLKEKYFGDAPALGKSITTMRAYDRLAQTYQVGGVYPDFPGNSHLSPDYLLSFEKLRLNQKRPVDAEWSNFNAFTFVKLHEKAHVEAVNALIKDQIVAGSTQFDMHGNSVLLQPIAEVHMQDFVAFGDMSGQVKKSSIYVLSGIGVLILGLVCINFFNLSTARSLERAKEVGVRKSVGASRRNLMGLYLTETGLQVILSLLLALILFEVSGDYFGGLLGTNLSMGEMVNSLGLINFLAFTLALVTVLVIGAGFYPSFIISGFRPIESLKGKVKLNPSKFSLGKSLLVIQFVITLAIGIVASIIYAQVDYMENIDPGYNRQSVISVQLYNSEELKSFGEELSADPLISSVTYLDDNLQKIFNSSTDYVWEGKPEDQQVRVYRLSVDNNFLESMDMKLLQGRGFDPNLSSDENSVILNENAARLMGISSLANFPTIRKGEEKTLNVIGIVANFKAGDFRENDKPVLLYRNPGRFYQAYIRLNSQNIPAALKSVEAEWKSSIPGTPFEYRFLDDQYERLLAKDRQTSSVLLFFTGLSILISFIGLFGMIRLRVQSRLKELGIRKILGAGFRQVIGSVSREFVFYLILAVVVGIPLAIYTGNIWLAEFAERISVTAMLPAFVVLIMAAIGLITLLFSTLPLTRLNLVETLKED